MSDTIIVKNNTVNPVFIEDLGIEIPGSGQRILSDTFNFTDICTSEELKTYVNNSTFTINNGTSDLNISDGLDWVDCKSDVPAVTPHSLTDHTDVVIPDPLDQQQLSYDSTASHWVGKLNQASSPEPPDDPEDGDLWFPDGESSLPWMWSENEWITVYRSIMTFSKGGNCDGEFLTIGGWVSADFYFFPRPGRICSIYCRAASGNTLKQFQLIDHTTSEILYNFSFNGSLTFVDTNMNVPVNSDSILTCYCLKEGALVADVIVQIEVAWRAAI